MVAFVGLNPSTADEKLNDPTIRRCINFAKDWGFDGMYMLNAFAFRATNPRDMKAAADPIGPENDHWLRHYASGSSELIACWGAHCDGVREWQVCEAINKPIQCLGLTKGRRPKHPLYIRADQKLELFWQP